MDRLSLMATRFESNTLVKDKTGVEEEEGVTEDSLDLEVLVMVEVPLTDLKVDLDLEEEEEEVTEEDLLVADLMEEEEVVGVSIVDLEEETGSLRDLQASEEGQAILLLEDMDHQEEEGDQMDLPSGRDLLHLEGKNKWKFSSGDVFFIHVFLFLHES